MCIFCDIISGEKKADIVYQDEKIIAFRDINPKAPVHILIVPRKHIFSINNLERKDLSLVSEMIWQAKEIAKSAGVQDGYKLVINNGIRGGQVVPHLHLHLLGGFNL